MAQVPKIGLALGSGGFRGFAHIGVIQVLQENAIPIDYVSGASIGALVGAYFSVYTDLSLLETEIVMNKKYKLPALFDFGFRGGFVSGKKFELFLQRMLQQKTFQDCRVPLQIVATDLISGQAHIIKSGSLVSAVRASTSLPLVFEPFKDKGRLLVDGGLSNPVPVSILKNQGADKVIAVNLYHQHEFIGHHFSFSAIAIRSAQIGLHNLASCSLRSADVLLNPDTSAFIQANQYKKYFDPDLARALIDVGRREAKRALPAIKKMLLS